MIKVNNDFYGYYFYKGNVFHDMGYYDSAVYMYNVAVIKNYQNADSYFYRARSYEQLEKYEKALEDYNTAIVMNDNDGSYYSKRGNCKHLMGNKIGACEDWNQAGNLGYYEDFEKVKSVCE
uniref:tetratricopeptide repeat protein n=1 Tax=Fulvivirga sp. TaxID=1931237 RepID=UPI00404B329A